MDEEEGNAVLEDGSDINLISKEAATLAIIQHDDNKDKIIHCCDSGIKNPFATAKVIGNSENPNTDEHNLGNTTRVYSKSKILQDSGATSRSKGMERDFNKRLKKDEEFKKATQEITELNNKNC